MSRDLPAVGIDLGTTRSAIARLDETGRPVTLPNAEGDLLTPSLVLFDGDDIVVGKEAFKALASEPEQVAECAKRAIGQRYFDKLLDGQLLPPQVIEAYILKKLRDDAARQIGEFQHVVITVPAYFDEVRRKATQDAAYIAGLELLDIINEPTAAAVAFGFQQGFLSPAGEAHREQIILVYDLGGGTFDVTVMKIHGNQFIALATDGDVQLGGQDWDQRLVDYVAEKIIERRDFDPREKPTARARLWRECEDAKRTLSARSKASINYDFQGEATQIEVTRHQFEELTHDLVERTRFTCREALRAAGLDWGSVDRVLLVGGSTRMPMVQEMLLQLTGKQPDASVSADEAVAHGAALHAGLLLDRAAGRLPAFQIRNVNSHSLGVVATDRETQLKRNAVVIPRNTPLPVTARRFFRTQVAGQGSVMVPIVEGESPSPDACTPIGRCTIADLPPDLPAGSPVEVHFHYEPNGRLQVYVQVRDATHAIQQEITRPNGMTAEELDQWRQRIFGDL